MVRVSNVLIGLVNTVTILMSLGAIAGGIWFNHHDGTDCQKVIVKPLWILGGSVFLVSLFGLIGSFCKVRWAMLAYTVLMFFLLIGLLIFTVFVFVVTNKGAGKVVSGRGYKEYRLGDYSHWLQKYVVNAKNWNDITSCLIDARVCQDLGHDDVHHRLTAADFYQMHLSSIQSGCCKPPTYCGYEYQNATVWVLPKSETGPAAPDVDCTAWSNNQTKLCYDCNSCKGGVLANIKKEWKHLFLFNICLLIVTFICYTIGCCAYRNNKSDVKYSRYRGYA